MVERKEETAMKKEYLDKIAEYGQLIVVSGPSGVGNKTVLREYLQDHERACVSVSVTTRRQRKHEIDGKDYWFVSVPEFERMVRMGEMLEYTYVTTKEPDDSMIRNNEEKCRGSACKREKCNSRRGYNRSNEDSCTLSGCYTDLHFAAILG